MVLADLLISLFCFSLGGLGLLSVAIITVRHVMIMKWTMCADWRNGRPRVIFLQFCIETHRVRVIRPVRFTETPTGNRPGYMSAPPPFIFSSEAPT